MEVRTALNRAANLRQSYIEISRFYQTWRSDATSFETRWTPAICSRRRQHTESVSRKEPSSMQRHEVERQIEKFKQSRIDGSATSTSWEDLRHIKIDSLDTPATSNSQQPIRVQLHGYLTSRRYSKDSVFIQFVDPRLQLAVQAIFPRKKPTSPPEEATEECSTDTARTEDSQSVDDAHAEDSDSVGAARSGAQPVQGESMDPREWAPHTAALLSGMIVRRPMPPTKVADVQDTADGIDFGQSSALPDTVRIFDPHVGHVDLLSQIEIQGESWKVFNPFTRKYLKLKTGTVLPPELRHLQFRTDSELRRRIRLRSRIAGKIRGHMLIRDFDEVETPLLFKSTPEGAREFIVPTRKKGMAYALPQSPQQYKQVLMASGISKYFQFARCFRDEDLRADRQPEFTQLDLEMAFATDIDVMTLVEDLLMNAVWPSVPEIAPLQLPTMSDAPGKETADPYQRLAFPRLSYQDAMSRYGSDKPDTRLGSEIRRVDHWLPKDVKEKITDLDDPVVEMFKLNMHGCEPAESRKFFQTFLDGSPKASYAIDKARVPGVAVYDPMQPLHGLFIFGHEGTAKLEADFEPEPGDLFLLWSREDKPFTGGSTVLGDLRRDVYQHAISQGLIPRPSGYSPLWVTDFPLFSPMERSEPGQGGAAGICSTHHPFTAPKGSQFVGYSQILHDPLSLIGDHYDLVINGVEVGGGSVRIHRRGMQEFILREVLQMSADGAKTFDHLLRALESGCPPHAGFALGFDRLMAMLTNSASVRDVIAFPKHADGEDKFAGAPSRIRPEQLMTYHLAVADHTKTDVSSSDHAEKDVPAQTSSHKLRSRQPVKISKVASSDNDKTDVPARAVKFAGTIYTKTKVPVKRSKVEISHPTKSDVSWTISRVESSNHTMGDVRIKRVGTTRAFPRMTSLYQGRFVKAVG